MIKALRVPHCLSVLALLVLCACGNGETSAGLSVFKQLPQLFSGKQDQTTSVSGAQIAQALTATSAPINLYILEERQVQFLMLDIQHNGPYQSYGSSSRQVIVMRRGLIHATRGLGGDLMNSDEDALFALVQARKAGQVNYVMRFVTPEDVTQTLNFTCQVAPGGQAPVVSGAVNETGQVVTARCQGEAGSFTNRFVVARDGYVLSGRQWLGDFLGYVSTQALRR